MTKPIPTSPPAGRRLPAAARNQREEILAATILVVGRKSYREATVEEVIAEAGIDRATFDEQFAGKQDCFLAAYDMAVERLFAEVDGNCDQRKNWLDRVREGLAAIVDLFVLEPELARIAVVEATTAGAEARRRHWHAISRFTQFLVEGHGFANGRELPASISLMSAGAVSGLIFEELLAGRPAELPALLPDLLFAVLVPYIGPRAAAAEMRRVGRG
ncbi:MAG TPA: helix-turn-helix domain-containing protein [Solirubrobacterales bacterium]